MTSFDLEHKLLFIEFELALRACSDDASNAQPRVQSAAITSNALGTCAVPIHSIPLRVKSPSPYRNWVEILLESGMNKHYVHLDSA